MSGLNSNPASSFRIRLQRSMLKKNLLSVETLEVTSIRGPHLFLPGPLPHAAVIPGSLPALAAVSPVSLQLQLLVMSSFKPHCPLITGRACWDCCFFPSLQDVTIKQSARSLLDTGRLLRGRLCVQGKESLYVCVAYLPSLPGFFSFLVFFVFFSRDSSVSI